MKSVFLRNSFRVLSDMTEANFTKASWKQLNEILKSILNE